MGVIYNFDYAAFIAQFPNFVYLPEPQVQAQFTAATTLIRNDGGGPVRDATVQSQCLLYATAHFCALFAARPDGTYPDGPVGRISSASEGSVSVSTEYGPLTQQGKDFWVQTRYGAFVWQMTAPYRTFRWHPGFVRRFDPWPFR